MKTRLLPAILLALALPAGMAAADDAVDDATQAQVRTLLTEQGYSEVRKIQMEDGLIEAYAIKDGEMFEVFLDAELHIVRVES